MEADGEEKTEKVQVWSWGAGTEGQLADGSIEDRHLPQPFHSFSSYGSISQIACGGAHAVARTRDGKVLTWGRGTKGQLGHGQIENCLLPKVVETLERFRVTYVSAGWNHTGFVTDTGRLFMCGDGSFGQLGTGDYRSHSSPVEVPFFAAKHVEQVACGMRHSLVLVTGRSVDTLYGFGAGKHGQIGNTVSGISRSICLPMVVPGFGNCRIDRICANGDHSTALTTDGQLYTWGKGFSGRLDNHLLKVYPLSMRCSEVALGWDHALVISDGQVYMLGGERHGMLTVVQKAEQSSLCISSDGPSAVPTLKRVPGLDGEEVVSIAAGAEHSALVTKKGRVMTWGWGEHGQLGLGNDCDQTCPQVVDIGYKTPLACGHLGVYCGSGFTFLVKMPH